jgi:hypothetical protein
VSEVEWLYSDASGDRDTCRYCGAYAETVDHLPPLTYAERMIELSRDELMATALVRVPCCVECNVLAGKVYHANIPERRAYVEKKLRRRYRRLLSVPLWSESELEECGYHLRGRIAAIDRQAVTVRERLHRMSRLRPRNSDSRQKSGSCE